MTDLECYYDFEGVGPPRPFPIYDKYRGQPAEDYSPLARGNAEFNPQAYETQGLAHVGPYNQARMATELQHRSDVPQIHRVEGEYLPLQRVLTNPSVLMAPCLISSIYQDGSFGRPQEVEDSAPTPQIQRSYGQWTAAPHDMVHTTPKQLLDYDYQALSQQDIADRARLAMRRAMYGV